MEVSEKKTNSAMKPGGTLAELGLGERGIIDRVDAEAALKRKLNALGVVKGIEVVLDYTAPMGDPRAYRLLGYHLSLRNEDARKILLQTGS